MGLYNILHGVNPNSETILGLVGLDTSYATVGRFRDAHISKKQDLYLVVLFTRNGGGNRDCYCDSIATLEKYYEDWKTKEIPCLDQPHPNIHYMGGHKYHPKDCRCALEIYPKKIETRKQTGHEPGCHEVIIADLQKHPCYLRDYDDNYDNTYAYFEFMVPDTLQPVAGHLFGEQDPTLAATLKEKSDEVLARMKEMTPAQVLTEYPEMTSFVKTLVEKIDLGTQ